MAEDSYQTTYVIDYTKKFLRIHYTKLMIGLERRFKAWVVETSFCFNDRLANNDQALKNEFYLVL